MVTPECLHEVKQIPFAQLHDHQVAFTRAPIAVIDHVVEYIHHTANITRNAMAHLISKLKQTEQIEDFMCMKVCETISSTTSNPLICARITKYIYQKERAMRVGEINKNNWHSHSHTITH